MKFSFQKNIGGTYTEVCSCSRVKEALQIRESYSKQGYGINQEQVGATHFMRLVAKVQIAEREFVPKHPCASCHAKEGAVIIYDYLFGGNRTVCNDCYGEVKLISECSHTVWSL